jgi:hypothetical protein
LKEYKYLFDLIASGILQYPDLELADPKNTRIIGVTLRGPAGRMSLNTRQQ